MFLLHQNTQTSVNPQSYRMRVESEEAGWPTEVQAADRLSIRQMEEIWGDERRWKPGRLTRAGFHHAIDCLPPVGLHFFLDLPVDITSTPAEKLRHHLRIDLPNRGDDV